MVIAGGDVGVAILIGAAVSVAVGEGADTRGDVPLDKYFVGALVGGGLTLGAGGGLGVLLGLSMYLPMFYLLPYGLGCGGVHPSHHVGDDASNPSSKHGQHPPQLLHCLAGGVLHLRSTSSTLAFGPPASGGGTFESRSSGRMRTLASGCSLFTFLARGPVGSRLGE